MKKSLVALAALAVAGAASAQSSVTLFGIVDAGISYYQTKSNHPVTGADYKQSKWALSNGNESMSRLGFRGTEDLGGGLAASFWLESQLDSGTGQAGVGTFFNRRSTVSLSGGFGEIRLGRDYVPTYWNDSVFDPFGAVGVGASAIYTALNGVDNNYPRASNSIGYFLPANLGGFYGQLQYAFDEGIKTDVGGTSTSNSAGRYVGGRVGYANGPLDVALAYGVSRLQDGPLFNTSVTPPVLLSNQRLDNDTLNLGASYDFGVAKLFGEYSQVKAKYEPVGAANYDVKYQGYLLGVTVPVGPGLIKAAYSHVDMDAILPGSDDPKADKFSLGYVHSLSKRTALYASFAYTKNKNGMALAYGGNLNYAAPAALGYVADKAYGYDFGIRHSF